MSTPESVATDGQPPDTPADQVSAPAAVSAEVVPFRGRNSLNAKVNYARALAASNLLPTAYRKRPENVLYAVEFGEMLRLSPMAAITGIHIIEGKPTASSALISALVRRAGHTLRVRYDAKTRTATAQIIRTDDPGFTFESTWDMERAKDAGLLGKDVWKKYAPNMLKARAITEVARDACEEELSGVHYTPEELGADVDEDGNPVGRVAVEQVDWAAEVARCGGDRDQLAALWHRAPEGSEARELIRQAAAAAGLKKETPPGDASAEPEDTVETVDAEIVEDAKPATLGELFDGLLAAPDEDTAARLGRTLLANPQIARQNVSGLLAAEVATELGADKTKKVSMAELARLAHQYVTDNGYSVLNGAAVAAQQVWDAS